MVVGLGVESADTDGQEPGSRRIRVQIGFDVGRMHDLPRRTSAALSPSSFVVNENLEGALASAMGELGVGSVEGPGALGLRRAQNLVGGHVEKLGFRIDEAAN
jgi:hypothetical protein